MKLTILALLATAVPALATVTLTFQGGSLRDSSGSNLAQNSIVIVVADTNNDGSMSFPSASDLLGSTLNSNDTIGGDRILSSFSIDNFAGANTGTFNHQESSFTLAAGTRLALYWFEGVTDASAAIEAGTKYGMFTSETVDPNSGGDTAFITPADGSAGNKIFYFDDAFIGSSSVAKIADFTANLTVVPEPSSTALLGLGSVALLLRRRR